MEFNHYFTNEELEAQLKGWVESYPRLAALTTLGESYEKRPIWLLTLTNQDAGPADQKPALWIDANIHATEITGTTAALCAADALLSGYGSDPKVTRLLDTCTFYFAPRLNPDGAALAMAPNPRFIRSGVRPYPYPEKDEGLHEQDIDGDGRILQMRLRDPNGDWKISSLDPRLMEKRGPDEQGGEYYRLLPEGLIEDYDGYLIRAARDYEGLDFNRNFPFEWRPEAEQQGAGTYPASEPEIHALVDFVSRHTNINLAITYHTFSRAILRPYSTRPDDSMNTSDLWVYKRLGAKGTELTGYRNISVYHDFRYHPKEVTTGAFDDWMFDTFGVFSFTIEMWDLPTASGVKDRKFIEWWLDHPHTEDVQILKWAEEHAAPGSYVEWYPFQHPQLGSVELGGFDRMYTWRNPPVNEVGAEATNQVPYVLFMAEILPHLSVHSLEITLLEEGKYRLNLVVENSGYLPTFTSQQAKSRKAVRPVRVELELLEGVQLVSGKRRVELGYLDGRTRDLSVSGFGAFDPTENRARAEWVLSIPDGATIKLNILSERAGEIHRELRFPPA